MDGLRDSQLFLLFDTYLQGKLAGTSISFAVERGGDAMDLEIVLGDSAIVE